MIVQSFDGNDINDGVIFQTHIAETSEFWGLSRQRSTLLHRLGRGPLISAISKPGDVLPVTIITLDGANIATHRDTLMGYFDVDEPKRLVITDSDGSSNERYKMAVPERVESIGHDLHLVTFRVHDDHHWRATTETSDSFTAAAGSDTWVNGGDADAYPVIELTPTSGNTAGFEYRQWMPVKWVASLAQGNYPYELSDGGMDTAALVTAVKAQADGDDFRVFNNGAEIDRWFGSGANAFNQAGTLIWINLNFEADVPMTLKTAIAGAGDVDTIEVNEDISKLPPAGIVIIDDEAFVYNSKSNADRTLNNCTRASRDTSAGAHIVGDDVFWIQNDLFIYYGNASAGAPETDDEKKPIINLDSSTNTSWVYASFGAVETPRSGSWAFVGSYYAYHANHGTVYYTPGTEWTEIGIASGGWANRWMLFNACGITNANFTNGEKYYVLDRTSYYWDAQVQSSLDGAGWVTEYDIPEPAVTSAWEAWSRNEALESGSKYVALYSFVVPRLQPSDYAMVEAADCTVTLDSSYTPSPAIATSEQGNYQFNCTIANTTTGESISLSFNCDLNETVEIDTLNHTVTYQLNGENIFSALTINGTPRVDWLKLQPGNNTITYTDAGGGGVTIAGSWRPRWR